MIRWFDERAGSADDAGSSSDDGFDAGWLDRLLDAPDPVSVPAEYRALATMLVAARGPVTDSELAGEALAVDAYRSSSGRFRAADPPPRRAVHHGRAVVVGVVLSALAATSVAAAAGSLPADVQDMASDALAKIGIHVPAGHRRAPPRVDESDDAGGRASILTPSDPTGEAGPIAQRRAQDGLVSVVRPRVAARPTVGVIDAVTAGLAPTPTLAEANATGTPVLAPEQQPASAAEDSAPGGPDPAQSSSQVANAPQTEADAPPATPAVSTVPASPNAPPNAAGPPAVIPASPHASPDAGGPPASIPASPHASPHAGGPPPANPNASPNAAGPPTSPPASPNASPHAGGPPTSTMTGAASKDDQAGS
jgi:hypothetical protein